MRTLKGKTIALLEGRQSDELAGMVARLGGTPLCAPAVREVPTDYDPAPLLSSLCEGRFSTAVILTGAAGAALFAEADKRGVLDEVRRALANMTLVCRGPKPQAALKRQGLVATLSTAKPHTTLDILETLGATDVSGMPLMLLHYGERNGVLAAALLARGALVEDVCLYEWALPEDVTPLHDVVRRIIDGGDVDALIVTSQVQIRFLLEIATADGCANNLVRALNEQVIVGAIGPVCASALRARGVIPDVLPASSNSASLVGAVADYFELTARMEESHT